MALLFQNIKRHKCQLSFWSRWRHNWCKSSGSAATKSAPIQKEQHLEGYVWQLFALSMLNVNAKKLWRPQSLGGNTAQYAPTIASPSSIKLRLSTSQSQPWQHTTRIFRKRNPSEASRSSPSGLKQVHAYARDPLLTYSSTPRQCSVS